MTVFPDVERYRRYKKALHDKFAVGSRIWWGHRRWCQEWEDWLWALPGEESKPRERCETARKLLPG